MTYSKVASLKKQLNDSSRGQHRAVALLHLVLPRLMVANVNDVKEGIWIMTPSLHVGSQFVSGIGNVN